MTSSTSTTEGLRSLEDLTAEELALLDRAVRTARESWLSTPLFTQIASKVFRLAAHDLVDSDGLNLEGYNRAGFNAEGFNRFGRNAEGLDARGFDQDGFNIEGLDSDGYNRDGLNANGEDKYCYDRRGNKRPAPAPATDATNG